MPGGETEKNRDQKGDDSRSALPAITFDPTDEEANQAEPESSGGVKVLLAARLAVISFFMGLVVFYKFQFSVKPTYLLILSPVAAAYLITIFYAAFLAVTKNIFRFIAFQLCVDTLLVSWVIFLSGGVESTFWFLYILIIIASAVLLTRVWTYVTAGISSFSYSAILIWQYYKFISPYYLYDIPTTESVGYYSLHIIMNCTVFFMVAYLSGYLTARLGESALRLQSKSEDFTLLKAYHTNVLDHMGSGFLAVDLDGIVLSHNPAAERILKLPSKQIDRKQISYLLQNANLQRVFDNINNKLKSEQNFDWQYFPDDGGDPVDITVSISRFFADGQTKGAVLSFQDVTNLRKMEKKVAHHERLAVIGQMAAGIAHEIRNPLASLSGSIQLLESDLSPLLGSNDKKLMTIINREIKRLNGTITSFLNYASTDKLILESVDMGELFDEVILLLNANIKNKTGNINIEKNIENHIRLTVDKNQIKQVFWNLLTNAVCAVEGVIGADKKIRIFAQIEEPEDKNKLFRLEVSDNGEGIAPEIKNLIFDPFYTDRAGGTGLGLATCQKIVQAHAGTIKFRSRVGEGTTFTVELPVR